LSFERGELIDRCRMRGGVSLTKAGSEGNTNSGEQQLRVVFIASFDLSIAIESENR
jgi:hypothetical protein